MTFKSVFSKEMPKKLIDHYAYGNGAQYKKMMDQTNLYLPTKKLYPK